MRSLATCGYLRVLRPWLHPTQTVLSWRQVQFLGDRRQGTRAMFCLAASREIGKDSMPESAGRSPCTCSGSQLDHHAAVVVAVPFDVRVVHVVPRRKPGRDVAGLAGLVHGEAVHVAGGGGVVCLRPSPMKWIFAPRMSRWKSPSRSKVTLLVHPGEPHPSRDLAGDGVVQFAFQ